jgi:hypothetical protein
MTQGSKTAKQRSRRMSPSAQQQHSTTARQLKRATADHQLIAAKQQNKRMSLIARKRQRTVARQQVEHTKQQNKNMSLISKQQKQQNRGLTAKQRNNTAARQRKRARAEHTKQRNKNMSLIAEQRKQQNRGICLMTEQRVRTTAKEETCATVEHKMTATKQGNKEIRPTAGQHRVRQNSVHRVIAAHHQNKTMSLTTAQQDN